MKYLKKFENHTQYEEAGQNLILPNVSLCTQENEVHYNPYVPQMNVITYQATEKLTETTTKPSQITNGLHTDAFSDSDGQQLTIKSHTFENGVGTIEFNGDIVSIGEAAFSGCGGLTSVAIGNSVTNIGDYAFNSCTSLKSITIPDSVTSIGVGAFGSCISLTSVTIPNNVTSIGQNAFTYCIGLSTITSYIMNAPSVKSGTFYNLSNGGTLYVPIGSSGYETWMNDQGNLGLYNWTKVEQ